MKEGVDKSPQQKLQTPVAPQNEVSDGGEQLFQFKDKRSISHNVEVLQKKADGFCGKSDTAQLQGLANNYSNAVVQPKKNNTGLPDGLKTGIESLSGISMDDVQVHRNSGKPAQLNAHAYAQGNQIHLAPGQEKHLPHEAWHVVQQKQGRVKPTKQLKGTKVNDDSSLEKEADVMGSKAIQNKELTSMLSQYIQPQKCVQCSRTSIVQRYKNISKKQYTKEGDSDSEHFFTTQSIDPSVSRTKSKKYKIQHQIERSNKKTGLKISDDDTIAINNTDKHAKEFYGHQTVFDNANKSLKARKSKVKLVKHGNLNLNTNSKKLWKIIPVSAADEEARDRQEFASLVSHICIEMASGVMGNERKYKHEAVFQDAGSGKQTVSNITSRGDSGDEKIERLAAAISNSPKNLDTDSVREKMHTGVKHKIPGKSYGRLHGDKQLGEKASKLGINEFARPEVGEGYATFSLSGGRSKQIDYAKTGKKREILTDIWGYHFATVVAKSLDGKDTITLENYNRTDDLYKQSSKIIDRLIQGNKERFEAILGVVSPKPNDSRYETQQKLIKAIQTAKNITSDAAQSEFINILQTYNAQESWFFMMQGSGKGQSFHEQQAESDAFVNPITLRVRSQDKEREELRSNRLLWINSIPSPPALLNSTAEFTSFPAEKSAAVQEITSAETKLKITTAFNRVKNAFMKFIIDQAVKGIERSGTESNVIKAKQQAMIPLKEQKMLNKFNTAIMFGSTTHMGIEDEIQKLYITEVEKHLQFVTNQFLVVDAVRYLSTLKDYYFK